MGNRKNLLKRLKYISVVGVSGTFIFIAHNILKMKEILNNAIDTSPIDVFEPPLIEPLLTESDITSDFYEWIRPTYQNMQEFYNSGSKFIKFLFARRMLNFALCDNQSLRLRAIEHLARLDLENWQYSLIAHMSDARTAVGLARTIGANERFFLPPYRKFGMLNNRQLFHEVKDYLNILYTETQHPCIKKVLSRVFIVPYDEGTIIDIDYGTEQISNIDKDSEHILPLCLESIRHHSTLKNYARDIMNYQGLYLLMEVYNKFSDHTGVCISICNILANISSDPTALENIFRAGWITILADWINNPDIRISGPAAQALANLDRDDVNYKFPANIYLLHPKYRTTEKIVVDVIFVHGLLGNVFYTWRNNEMAGKDDTINLIGKKLPLSTKEQEDIGITGECDYGLKTKLSSDPATQEYVSEMEELYQSEYESLGHDFEFVYYDIPEKANLEACGPYTFKKSEGKSSKPTQCWPRDWLPQDCSNIRVIGVNYSTNISSWAHICPEMPLGLTLDDRSSTLLDNLIISGVGNRPIVWVTHSMGGLLVKNLLSMGLKSKIKEERKVALNTKAIVFYSTPHFGSKSANLNQPTSYVIWPSTEVQELREGSPNLIRIQNDFLRLTEKIPIKIVSLVETKPTVVSALKLNFNLVEPESGNPKIGEYFEIPQNHLGICKPTNRESFLYQKIVTVIKQVVDKEFMK